MRTLNLSGNPFSEEVNYKEYVIAHLPELVYLDFRLIDESAREAATEKYKYSIEEMVQNETIAKRKQDEVEENQKERQLHKVHVYQKESSYGWNLAATSFVQCLLPFDQSVKVMYSRKEEGLVLRSLELMIRALFI